MYYWKGPGCLHIKGKMILPLEDPTKPDPKSKIPKGALTKESLDVFKKKGKIVSLAAEEKALEKAKAEKAAADKAAADEAEAKEKAAAEKAKAGGQGDK